MGDMNKPSSDGSDSATRNLSAIRTQSYSDTEPTFLGADYVCTELPTHITRARTKEQQALVERAYEGWSNGV